MCHGNINRSPLCAEILRQSGKYEVKSAGFVNPNRRAAKKMRDAAMELGYNLEEHRSQLLDEELYLWADKIIIMDGGNEKRFVQFTVDNPHLEMNCPYKLGHFLESPKDRIPDPAFIKRGTKEFHDVVLMIEEASKKLIENVA